MLTFTCLGMGIMMPSLFNRVISRQPVSVRHLLEASYESIFFINFDYARGTMVLRTTACI